MAERYKCLFCGKYKNKKAYDVCKGCEKEAEKEKKAFEKEFGKPKKVN